MVEYENVGDKSYGIHAADLDNDGDIDLAVVNEDSSDVQVMLNHGDALFRAVDHSYAVGHAPHHVVAADVDGDGDLDLVTSNEGAELGDITVLLNTGAGIFQGAPRYDPSVEEPEALAIGDLDGDGDGDLVLISRNANEGLYVMLNDGSGKLELAHYQPMSIGATILVLGDVDQDGDLDLAYPYLNDAVLLLNDGSGVFGSLQEFGNAATTIWVLLDDLNGDGLLDLVSCSTDYRDDEPDDVSVRFNTGDGSFGSPQVYSSFDIPTSVTSGDFDNDGDRDLAVVNFATSDVSVLINFGDGTFADSGRYPAAAPATIASADLDGDGDFDLVTGSDTIFEVSVLLSNGDSTFAPAVQYEVGPGHYPFSIADVDLDGDEDIVSLGNSSLWVLFNSGDGTFAERDQYAGGYDLQYLASGELNGDGYPDFAVSSRLGDGVTILLSTPGCACDGDVNGDGMVDPLDSGFVLARFGCDVGSGDPDCDIADMNDDGLVDPLDVGFILARFGPC